MANKIKKISIDHGLCIGCGTCVSIQDSVFELSNEGKSVLKQKNGVKNAGPAGKENLEDKLVADDILMTAAESCPVKAILLYDKDDKQIYP